MNKLAPAFTLLATSASLFAGDATGTILAPRSNQPTGWTVASVSAGTSWRSLGNLDYAGRSRSGDLMIPSQVGGDSVSLPAIGTTGNTGDRAYLDGFVDRDASTDANGETWNWGYDSAGQVRGNELLFSAVGARSIYSESQSDLGRVTGDERLEGLSPQIDFLLLPPSTFKSPFEGLLISFWYFGDDSDRTFSNFSARQDRQDFRIDFTDRYDISAIAPLIGSPYVGSFEGPGPLLSNLPLGRDSNDVLIGGDSAEISNSISTSLDLDGYSLAIGPTLSGTISNNWAWQASGGVTLNVFKWSASETENLNVSLNGAPPAVLQSWTDHRSDTDFCLGLYAKGEVIRSLSDDWFVKGYFQAEMAESIEMEIGESDYEFKPRGYALGLSVGHEF